MSRKKIDYRNNYEFIDSAYLNNATVMDFLLRLKIVALSRFQWKLPKSMDSFWLERCLYYDGQATLLKDKNYGFINTKCCTNGKINIYGLPVGFNCYSFEYSTNRKLYTGLNETLSQAQQEVRDYYECILVQNMMEREATASHMELYALRMYEAQRSADVNVQTQKFPYIIVTDEAQRLTMINLYKKVNGNEPAIFGDKNNLNPDQIRVLKTDSEFIADKLNDYKKEIWNEALTFLGINNIMIQKKERLITDEANSNNDVINCFMENYLAPRKRACEQFNEKYRLKGTENEISVRITPNLKEIVQYAQNAPSNMIKNNEVIKNG